MGSGPVVVKSTSWSRLGRTGRKAHIGIGVAAHGLSGEANAGAATVSVLVSIAVAAAAPSAGNDIALLFFIAVAPFQCAWQSRKPYLIEPAKSVDIVASWFSQVGQS